MKLSSKQKNRLMMFTIGLMIGFTIYLLTGCGHNVVSNSRGTGIEIAWDGSSYIPTFRLGQWDVTNVVVKENVSIETSTNTTTAASTQLGVASNADASKNPSGATQANAGGGIVLKMKTGPQSNGYVKDILTSSNLSQQSVDLADKIYGVETEQEDSTSQKK